MKNNIETHLEEYYSGDENWNRFVKIFSGNIQNYVLHFEKNDLDKLSVMLNFRKDLAISIYGIMGTFESAKKWIYTSIPLLDGLRPIDCLQTESQLKRLKELLMRFPA